MNRKSHKSLAALFVRSDSFYSDYPFVDCYDIYRDARNFNSDLPVVAHPPCRGWSRLRAFAKPRDGEKQLAFFALEKVRANGGVLEHPANSSFWKSANLPRPGQRDDFGICVSVPQFWFGHLAQKNTWLYISGLDFEHLPKYTIELGIPEKTVCNHLSHKNRELMPKPFAEFLVTIALLTIMEKIKVA